MELVQVQTDEQPFPNIPFSQYFSQCSPYGTNMSRRVRIIDPSQAVVMAFTVALKTRGICKPQLNSTRLNALAWRTLNTSC